jgi:thiamine-phosphate pyrophosphorylase
MSQNRDARIASVDRPLLTNSADPSTDMPTPTGQPFVAAAEPAVLRLIDANANRAREALRVLEDYARFVLNDASLSAGLKEIRHRMAVALASLLPTAILQRDTAGDVGTANKTASELARADLQAVVVAAGKRLGEALRSIEEFAKTADPVAAGEIERLRYRFYDLEAAVARSFGFRRARFADVRLYVLITESVCRGDWLSAAEQAIAGGADCLQLREKSMESGELLRRARLLVDLCHRHGVLCIINDRPDIALLADADGVHVGQGDLPATAVRGLVGPEKIVGVSTHEIAHARQAIADGADYIGVGPFFRSPTKPRDFVAGPAYARQVAAEISIPAVAIAGITDANVHEVTGTGIRAVAVTAAVVGAENIADAARRIRARLTTPS